MSYISFNGKPQTTEHLPGLVESVGLTGKLKFYEASACRIIAEDNPGESVEVHVALRKRTAIVEAPEKRTGTLWRTSYAH